MTERVTDGGSHDVVGLARFSLDLDLAELACYEVAHSLASRDERPYLFVLVLF